ncbi:hypothetical protein [Portibacter marinus]|uniref:hypothetical protein n=1 Tax=Portibacter marinus TaxID=2898660 RepID=UPI001F2CF618|nr:hypothetical protein [Portibacter marinus]
MLSSVRNLNDQPTILLNGTMNILFVKKIVFGEIELYDFDFESLLDKMESLLDKLDKA